MTNKNIDFESLWSDEFIAQLPERGPIPCSKSYDLRPLNAILYVIYTKNAEVCVLQDSEGLLTVSSVELL
jgi:hypothetical protein